VAVEVEREVVRVERPPLESRQGVVVPHEAEDRVEVRARVTAHPAAAPVDGAAASRLEELCSTDVRDS
jgi:hypothetical protein